MQTVELVIVRYPTPKQYKEVAMTIVTQYPHLRDTTPGSRGYVSSVPLLCHGAGNT